MIVRPKFQTGLTLVELIVSMVVISVGLTAILSVMDLTIRHSADPIIEHQAIAIAEAYLEEILLLSYADPDSETGETRATFDDVDDYHGLSDAGVHDQSGTAVSSLSDYNVAVTVVASTVSGVAVKRVAVAVSKNGLNLLTLTGYRGS